MKRASICTLIPLVLFAACSSSENGFTDPGPDNDPAPTGFAITPTNGAQVAQVAYQSVLTSGDMAGLTGSTGLTAGGTGGMSKPSMDTQIGGILGDVIQNVPLPAVETVCGLGPGTVTVTFDVVDPLVFATGLLSAGDTILVEYVDCDEGFGEVLDGTIDFTVDAFTGDLLVTGLFDMTMTMNLIDFQITIGADVLTSNGDATATLNNMAAPFVSASVSGNSMTTDTNNSSEVLTNYASSQTVDAALAYTMDALGTLNSSQLTGTIAYSTPVMFEGVGGDYPNVGELLVTAATGSARLVAQSNGVDVHILIYASTDGTGDPEQTIMTTWAELEGT